MSDGPKAEKPEVKQEESSSSSIWSEIAQDVALTAVMGPLGFGVSKGITAGIDAAKSKAAIEKGEELGKLVAEVAIPLVTLGVGAGLARAAAKGAAKGAEAALKSTGKEEESTLDKAFDMYKALQGDTLPLFMFGPLALMPQVREPIKQADGLVLDKIKSVSETMFERAKNEPWRFAAMTVGSPLLPVLDAIINDK